MTVDLYQLLAGHYGEDVRDTSFKLLQNALRLSPEQPSLEVAGHLIDFILYQLDRDLDEVGTRFFLATKSLN